MEDSVAVVPVVVSVGALLGFLPLLFIPTAGVSVAVTTADVCVESRVVSPGADLNVALLAARAPAAVLPFTFERLLRTTALLPFSAVGVLEVVSLPSSVPCLEGSVWDDMVSLAGAVFGVEVGLAAEVLGDDTGFGGVVCALFCRNIRKESIKFHIIKPTL